MKAPYPVCVCMHLNVFLRPINKGICARTTICAHMTHGQKNDNTHEGTMFSLHANIDVDQAPVGMPITSKLEGGESKCSSPGGNPPNLNLREKNIDTKFIRARGQLPQLHTSEYRTKSRPNPQGKGLKPFEMTKWAGGLNGIKPNSWRQFRWDRIFSKFSAKSRFFVRIHR